MIPSISQNIGSVTLHDAARDISAVLREYGNEFTEDRIANVLRSYVSLGERKKIYDYPNSTRAIQTVTAQAVVEDVSGWLAKYGLPEVLNDLNEVAVRAQNGTIDLRIAYPRLYQERLEQAIADSHSDTAIQHANDPNFLAKGANDFFGFVSDLVGKSLAGILKNPVVLLIVAVVLFLLFKRSPIPYAFR